MAQKKIKKPDRPQKKTTPKGKVASRKNLEQSHSYDSLLASEETIRALLNAPKDNIFLIDTRGTILAANESIAEKLGVDPHSLSGRNIYTLLPDDAARRRRSFVQEAVRTKKVVYFEDEREGTVFHHTVYPIQGDGVEVKRLAIFARDITETKRAEEGIRRQTKILEGVNRIFEETLDCDTEEDFAIACLEVALNITDSKFGFFGELGSDGLLHDLAISDLGWEQCTMREKIGHRRPPGDFPIRGLYGRVLRDGKSLLTNSPSLHPDSAGAPSGHPQLSAFLGVPLVRAGKAIGMLAVGNRENGYQVDDQKALEALAPTIAEAWDHLRAEHKLRESEERLRVALEGGQLALWDRDFVADRIMWNAKMYDLVGRDPEGPQISGDTFFQYIHPEDRARVLERVEKWLQDGEVFQGEFRVVRDDGDVRWLASAGYVHRDETGRPTRMSGVNYDITERKKTEKLLQEAHDELETRVKERTFQLISATKALEEEILERRKTARALRASEEKHRSLVERIPAVIYSASMKDNTSVYVSPQIKEFLGYTQEEWLADPHLWWKRVHPEDRARVKREFQQGKMEGKSFSSRYRILDRSGTVKWFRDDAIFSKDGDVYHGIMFDITTTKEIEQNLNRQREILQSTFDNIPVMLCFYDADGRVSWVNQEMERVTGYTLEDFRKMDVMETFYPDPEYRKWVWDYMMTAEMGWQDFRLRTRYGSDLESSWSNVRLSDGSQIGIGIDITKRLENEAKLRYLSSRLLEVQETERRNVALELHDGLGGSLLGIKMAVERKLSDIRKGRTASEGTKLEEILELVRSCMRDSSRIQHNLRPSVLDHLGLAPALRSLCREFENAHEGIRTACTLQIDKVDVPEDLKITIYRISQEALTNTAKHSKAENVSLSLTHQNDQVELMVRDDGCGFDTNEALRPEKIRRGVGLASMKERCEILGGNLFIDSHMDEGTMIRATWPLPQTHSPKESPDL